MPPSAKLPSTSSPSGGRCLPCANVSRKAQRRASEADGVNIRLNAKCISLEKRDGGVAIGLTCEEGPPEVVGTDVLLAVGRIPNTSDLGLNHAGVASDQRGYVTVDEQLQTDVPGIWASGDCNGRGAFTHTSYNDYEIVADNLFNADHRRVSDRIQAYALYIDPPLGRCGMTDADVRKSGHPALAAKFPMSQVSRASKKARHKGSSKIASMQKRNRFWGLRFLESEAMK